MSVTKGQKIQRQTLNGIVGAINSFNDSMNSAINNSQWWTNNYPHFSGSVNWGNNTSTGNLYLQNPQAIPSNQFTAKSIEPLTITNDTISAMDLWNKMREIALTLNRIRYINAQWYHRVNGSRTLVNQFSGRAMINTSFPAVPSGSDNVNGQSQFWTRSGGNVTLNPTKSAGQTAGQTVTASSFNSSVDNCFNEWKNKLFTNNQINYTMYTCHLNCHSNCHSDRGRR